MGQNKKKYHRKKVKKCFVKEVYFKIQFEGEWDLKEWNLGENKQHLVSREQHGQLEKYMSYLQMVRVLV